MHLDIVNRCVDLGQRLGPWETQKLSLTISWHRFSKVTQFFTIPTTLSIFPVGKTRVPGENPRLSTEHWQTLFARVSWDGWAPSENQKCHGSEIRIEPTKWTAFSKATPPSKSVLSFKLSPHLVCLVASCLILKRIVIIQYLQYLILIKFLFHQSCRIWRHQIKCNIH